MNKIKTIIIDDEQLGRDLIKEYLKDHSEIEVMAECRDGHEAYQAITDLHPDLIFLDIQMPEINGFELLEMLDVVPQVVFSTAYDHYAIKAFEINAVDYLLKPYDQERFNIALNRAIQSIHAKLNHGYVVERLLQTIQTAHDYQDRILIKQAGKIIIVSCKEIRWIEAMDDYVELHLIKEKYLIQQSMAFLESRLNPDQFIRTHRSYLINLDAIKEIVPYSQGRYQLVLKDGKEIPLSRSGAKKLKKFMI
jgi:two-component system, LytTR family, response regulator